ncbi:histidine phosphatase family protein [Nocardia carnea]|uniref:histidine phosphatase family protein n=1 Tax=Nocardia carnea TaxID=37328 RepID=UPI002457249D|nr:histidine phosphatase family protein [Nocardia carnea]
MRTDRFRRLRSITTTALTLLTLGALTACGSDTTGPHATTTVRGTAGEQATITITLMRHAESAGNASGLIDTSTPGPELTTKGRTEAQAAAETHGQRDFDGVYASTMVRTQQTASYMAGAVAEPVEVLSGLREIEAGQFEKQPESTSQSGYLQAPLAWIQGRRDERIPGSIDGNEFDHRFDVALRQIYDSGDTHPIAFAHGGSIMIWTLMNVDNPDPDKLKSAPLGNTDYVTIEGSPDSGWSLIDWNGMPITR